MRVLFWLVIAVLAAVLCSFAASNREPVSLALWPLDSVLQVPLYLAELGGLILGLVLGALLVWAAGHRRRREARQGRRRIAALEREITAARPRQEARSAALLPRG